MSVVEPVINLANHNRTNRNSKQIYVATAKRGKTRTCQSRLVLMLLLFDCKSGAGFSFSQSRNVALQNQGNCEIVSVK